MIGIDDFLIGVICSGIVSWVSTQDTKIEKASQKKLNELTDRCKRVRSAQGELSALAAQAVRDKGKGDPEIGKLADAVMADPMLPAKLTTWLLEPDPKKYGAQKETVKQQMAKQCKCDPAKLAEFLEHLERRVDNDLGLSQLRGHQEHRLILANLSEQIEWQQRIERQNVYVVAILERLLRERPSPLFGVVRPKPQAWTSDNDLLWGKRPRDKYIDQDLDFRRQIYKEVMDGIKLAGRAQLLLAFLADQQQGKTTFLKRIGWDLAKEGYPVLQLEEDAHSTRYADEVKRCEDTFKDLPPVLLIDNPAQGKENFKNQMASLYDWGKPVIVLTAENRQAWEKEKLGELSLIGANSVMGLYPRITEATDLVQHLEEKGVVHLEPDQREKLLKNIENIATGPGYFHEVIEAASHDKYKAVSQIVDAHLRNARGSAEADAFERLYTYVCVPGAVGLSLPERIANAILPLDKRTQALKFSADMPTPPIRVEENVFAATHERYAQEFLEGRDLTEPLRAILEAVAQDASLTPFAGRLLQLMYQRGNEEAALNAWDTIASRFTDEHWNRCTPEELSQIWGTFFYATARVDDALRVVRLAVEINPRFAEAHNNYAILLKEQGEPDEARKHYEKALEINPRGAEVYYNYANFLKEQGELDEASKHYEKALGINPRSVGAHNNYALLLEEQGKPKKAHKHYEEALEINPRRAEVAVNLSTLCLDEGDVPQALNLAVDAVLSDRLPDAGLLLIEAFAEHAERLEEIVRSATRTAKQRGGALAFLLAAKREEAKELAKECWDDPTFEPARRIAEEMLSRWLEPAGGEQDSQAV